MNGHRLAVALESVLLGIPTTAFFITFGPLMAMGVFQEPSGFGFTMLLFLVLGAIALFYFWRLAFAFVMRKGRPAQAWWWGASIGALLVLASAALIGAGKFGLEAPESLIPLAFGAFGAPMLLPLVHMWLVRVEFPAGHT